MGCPKFMELAPPSMERDDWVITSISGVMGTYLCITSRGSPCNTQRKEFIWKCKVAISKR